MDYNVLLETGTGNSSEKLSFNRMKIEGDNKHKGFASLKKGQLITGTVVSVDEQITLNFNGQKVTTQKSVLNNAIPGEIKTFEVMKITESEIELRPMNESSGNNKKSFKAAMVKEADWEMLQSQKEQVTRKTEQETEYKDILIKLEEISSKLTELDYRLLEEEGFGLENFSVSGLYEALNRIKESASGDEQKKAGKMKAFEEEALMDRLKEENLPATSENLSKLTKALELSNTVAKLDDKAMKYLISRGAMPTIENIYKAYYSQTVSTQENQHALTGKEWSELESQVKDVIKSAGYEVNQENLDSAKWLIENKLLLTPETFTYKKDLEEIKVDADKDAILNKMLEGMKNGVNPKDASLLLQKETSSQQLITNIHSIRKETITKAVKDGTELTIKKLVTIQESLDRSGYTSEINPADQEISATKEISEVNMSKDNPATGSKDEHYIEIKAQRQLEEIRLKMTLEAAAKFEKKGFKVETQQLEKVVEALRDLEDNYYKDLLKEADVLASELSMQILKETTQSVEQIKYIPSQVLGSTLSYRNVQTIPGLLSEGAKLQAELSKAGTAYETLMTVPNREYGDSIKKAFANVDSLLSQLNFDNTEQNQRAVRILGYNQMEITEENISKVKAYDLQVQSLLQNLHPAVTVRMIKEGMNPLEMPINELNRTIDQMKNEQGITSEEKFSTYLQKLEKESGISSEERKAYIGIYRLLYNVEKSDGAALGAVIKAEREVTLDHLLTAVYTGKKGKMDAVINDEFGPLQSISHSKDTILEQLSAFSNGTGQQSLGQPTEEDLAQEQTEYLNRILKQITEELSPQKLMEAGQNLSQGRANNSQTILSQTVASQVSLESGIWKTVKDIPVERLLEQLRSIEEAKNAVEENAAYTEKVQELRELCKNSEQSIRFLNDFKVPSTPLNIMITNHILSNGESPIKKLLKLQNENIVEKSENSLKELNDLSDTLIDKHSMEEAYAQLEKDAKAALDQAYSVETIDSRKLAELKSMGQQMTFVRTLAEKECYQIPIETDKGITNINLTILRGTQTSGNVAVTVWSEQLGNIKADFTLKESTLKGFISSDNRRGLEQLQKNAGEIEQAAARNDITIKQLDFGVQHKEYDTYSYQNPNTRGQSTVGADTERVLYHIAKAIVCTVRLAENSGEGHPLAIS